jgi:hypothetical protein
MNTRLPSLHINLLPQQPLSIEEGQSTRVKVLEGLVWITEENCRDDFFVKAGETLELTRPGKAVLLSDVGARVELLSNVPVSVHTPTLWSLLPSGNKQRGEPRTVRQLGLYAH